MFLKTVCTGMAALAMSAATALGEPLQAGDKAPTLGGDVTWLQGEPVSEWQPGQVYVLDFWATWCGPCIAGIPHMNDIAKKHKDDGVHVIGLAVFPQPGMTPTPDFLKDRKSRDPIKYAIGEDVDGRIGERFMVAAQQNSIPTVMIVDRAGTLAWIGHPSQMDPVLDGVIAGTYDAKLVRKGNAMLDEAQSLAEQGQWNEALALVDKVVDLSPGTFAKYAVMKYQLLHVRLGRFDDAKAYGLGVVDGVLKDDAEHLNQLAWFIVDDGIPVENRDLELARKAIDRAMELTNGVDSNVLDTAAAVAFKDGRLQEALALQTKAVELLTDDRYKADMVQRLEKYQALAKSN